MFIDELNYDQCWELWSAINQAPVTTARKLFPNKPPQYVVVTKLLSAYAANKGTALSPTSSNIAKENRSKYIKIAASIYLRIPAWARTINIDFLKEKENMKK